MEKVKIGFLGCGYMGQNAHLANYAQLESCEIVAVCDAKRAQAELVASRYGVQHVCSEAEELLSNPDITAIVAAQNFESHVDLVPRILLAGKHLLTEKPLCIFPENGEKLARLAAEKGLIHMVAYHKRSDPAVEYAVDIINAWKKSGEMGPMRYVRLTMPPGDWIGGANKAICTDEPYVANTPEASPAGVDKGERERTIGFVNYYIHQVNLMRYLFGEDYALTFASKSGVLLVAQSFGGVAGVLEMSPYCTTDDWQESAIVCFEKGWVRVELPAPLAAQRAGKVTVFQNNGPVGVYTQPVLPNVCAMRNQAANFIKAVRGEKTAPCVSAEAVKDLRIAADYISMTGK